MKTRPISFPAVPLTYFVKQYAQLLTGYQPCQGARTRKTPVLNLKVNQTGGRYV